MRNRFWSGCICAGIALTAGVPVYAEESEMTKKEVVRIDSVDSYMQDKPVDAQNLVWFQADEAPMQLNGFYWYKQDQCFRRLPLKPDQPISDGVDYLANHTAGGQVRFVTDSFRVVIKADLETIELMPHMAATGSSGFDIYVGEPTMERYQGTARPDTYSKSPLIETCIFGISADYGRKMRVFTLNFPLYNRVKSLEIGIDADAKIQAPPAYVSDRPVVVYGTSITQGGCASRPGNAYTNILARRLNRPFINLGFSGNGKGEAEMARLIAEIQDPALFIVDYEANSSGTLEQTLPEFLRIYRETHPETPILVLSGIRFGHEALDQAPAAENRRADRMQGMRDIAERTVKARVADGDRHIFFFDGGFLLNPDSYDEATVDGIHPTDLGFRMMADNLEGVIREILAKSK